MLDIKKLQARINVRQEKLQQVSVDLKAHFVGLDNIIDRLIQNIEAWYIMPEILTRPTILNLWGMTGVGKTDLVRRLARHLGFIDRFLEVQLTTKGAGNDYWVSSVESIIDRSSLESEKPGILLLDEIQRFRSISDKNEEIHDYKFQDVWSLLSDGLFSSDATRKIKINELIFDIMWEQELEQIRKAEAEAEDENGEGDKNSVRSKYKVRKPKVSGSARPRKFQQSWWKAQRVKKLTKVEAPIEEIMGWSIDKNIKVLQNCLDSAETFNSENYSQLLIIVSGNLDEAFGMASHASNADIDADVFHDHSTRINFVDIKKALKKRFKPEQIARFGNTHLIYPSLSSDSYKEIIRRKIQQVTERLQNQTGLTLTVQKSLRDAIYRNGVFPSQGTRPLFSTLTSMLENSLPSMVLAAVRNEEKSIDLLYDTLTNEIVGKIGEDSVRLHYEGELDKIRNNFDTQARCFAAVHEAGHAVAYSIAFKTAPTQISINTSDDEGFVGPHTLFGSKQNLLNDILVSVAGRAAENLVFGDEHKNSGCQSDIARATKKAVEMVRDNGMYDRLVAIIRPHAPGLDLSYYSHDYEDTDKLVEKLVGLQAKKATALLKENLDLFRATVKRLLTDKNILPETYIELCKAFGLNIAYLPTEKQVISDYLTKYEKFFEPSTGNTQESP